MIIKKELNKKLKYKINTETKIYIQPDQLFPKSALRTTGAQVVRQSHKIFWASRSTKIF
jgi:hypothetical protein